MAVTASPKRNNRLSRLLHKLGPKKRDSATATTSAFTVSQTNAQGPSAFDVNVTRTGTARPSVTLVVGAGDGTVRVGKGKGRPCLALDSPKQQPNGKVKAAVNGKATVKVTDGDNDSAQAEGRVRGSNTPVMAMSDGESFVSAAEGVGEGADPDASIRPLTPSSLAAPSYLSSHTTHTSLPAPSIVSASTYDSTHTTNDVATFSSRASTKPTTVMSLDGGANRIAVPSPTTGAPSRPGEMAQPAPSRRWESAAARRHPQTDSESNSPTRARINGIGGAGPSSTLHDDAASALAAGARSVTEKEKRFGTVPRYSAPHPSQNPHPAAAPGDNASMLTLASSGFAPSARTGVSPDEDASVRALAPSRRESAESLSSRWSAAVLTTASGTAGLGGRPASLRTVGTGTMPVTGSGLKEELDVGSSGEEEARTEGEGYAAAEGEAGAEGRDERDARVGCMEVASGEDQKGVSRRREITSKESGAAETEVKAAP